MRTPVYLGLFMVAEALGYSTNGFSLFAVSLLALAFGWMDGEDYRRGKR